MLRTRHHQQELNRLNRRYVAALVFAAALAGYILGGF